MAKLFGLYIYMQRAYTLGDHAVLESHSSQCPITKRPVKYTDIDLELLSTNLQDLVPPTSTNDITTLVDETANLLYQCVKSSKKPDSGKEYDRSQSRWQRILDSKDEKLLWQAVNWKGEFDGRVKDAPPSSEFQQHFEQVLNPDNQNEVDFTGIDTNVTIPILDNLIHPDEVEAVLNRHIKPNKGSGPDGVPPGILTLLPASWIIFLASLFNTVFQSGYPISWAYARMVVLFKKGRHDLCDNYRAINIINSIAKVYDYVLYKRLALWFSPSREQAGAQPGRGCMEHIISLRLLLDYATYKRQKLYIVFIDFSKAYDRLPRDILIKTLKHLGCGMIMLYAIMSMYKVSYSVLGAAVITAAIGIRQGSPTSCFLFTCYVDRLIKMVKERSGADGFLRWLHVLMLMDDTVILATSREQCLQKLNIVVEFCNLYGMMLNQGKTKFMVVNSTRQDKLPLEVNFEGQSYKIEWSDTYVYLGSIFTYDGKISNAIKAHQQDKYKHYLKFVSFINKNQDFPFPVKHKVFSSAMLASVLYGCESWLTHNLQGMNKLYISAIKVLLGVRQTAPNEACLVELGYPPLRDWIKHKQENFFKQALTKREGLHDDPLMFCIKLIKTVKSPSWKYLDDLLRSENYFQSGIALNQQYVRSSDKSKLVTYHSMNQELTVHSVYKQVKPVIPEYHRKAFTRLRVVSHNLRIETGRWARLPPEARLCRCGQIQTEKHAVQDCEITKTIRDNNEFMNFQFANFFKDNDNNSICKAVFDILNALYVN